MVPSLQVLAPVVFDTGSLSVVGELNLDLALTMFLPSAAGDNNGGDGGGEGPMDLIPGADADAVLAALPPVSPTLGAAVRALLPPHALLVNGSDVCAGAAGADDATAGLPQPAGAANPGQMAQPEAVMPPPATVPPPPPLVDEDGVVEGAEGEAAHVIYPLH